MLAEILNSSSLSVDIWSNLCQVDGQLNVGEMRLTKFQSNWPAESTLSVGPFMFLPTAMVFVGKHTVSDTATIQTNDVLSICWQCY